jgi:hypothetical protein
MSNRRTVLYAVLMVALAITSEARAAHPASMIGRQSQNEGIKVLPAPGVVTIDGDLKDWDWTGRIWVFADSNVRNRYSVEAAAMWDNDAIYLAAKWKDPTPMFSMVNPAFNPQEGWKSDSWQLRVQTDEVSHLTTWYYAPEKAPALHVTHAIRGIGEPQFVLSKAGETNLGQGVEMAYRADEDGKGYVQEIKIPWAIIYKTVPKIEPGLVLGLGMEFLWGDPTGNTWPIHRYADNMQPGKTSREFYWSTKAEFGSNVWGSAELVGHGNVPIRAYVSDSSQIAGTIPIRLVISERAARFTIAINNEKGERIRNLAGDFSPEDYSIEVKDGKRTVEVKWDGLDDAGKLASPGTYQAVGLSHNGLGAEYDTTFYNPGTPPWAVVNGTGAWGADHTGPSTVATAGDSVVLGCPGVEGGSGIFVLGADDRKKWGEKRETSALAGDSKYVYAIASSWYVKSVLCRFSRDTGASVPFELNRKPRTFELSNSEIFDTKTKAVATAIAVHGDSLVLALDDRRLAILDASSAAPKKVIKDVANVTALAFAKDGVLYAVEAGKLVSIDLDSGAVTSINAQGLGTATGVCIDSDGNLVTADTGPDCQVKAFTRLGSLAYTAGTKGGRAVRGVWNAQAMRQMSSIAVDAKNQIWVTEFCETPRRVSVWGKDGKLIRDFIGNTGYAATDTWLHDEDPTLAYVGPVEIKLDREKQTSNVTQVMWVPEANQGESFQLSPHSSADWGQSSVTTSTASGNSVSYVYAYKGPSVVFMKRGDSWKPVAAICSIEQLLKEPGTNKSAFADVKPGSGLYWNDTNKNAKVERDECTIVEGGLPVGASWSAQMGPDLSIYAQGLSRYKPIGFTDDGAPIYGPAGRVNLGGDIHGSIVPAREEQVLFVLSYDGYPGPTKGMMGLNPDTGKVMWTYPNRYPGVHGSHAASMPKPGLLIGAMKICGVAKIDDTIGTIALVRGNLGQDYFFTADGLYVGALFQDCRLPTESLPQKEPSLRGVPMEGFSEGGEPFNGYFVKQSDGKVRLTTGIAREAGMILEIKGLESVRRMAPMIMTVDQAALAQCSKDNASRLAATSGAKQYVVKKLTERPSIDPNVAAWAKINVMPIEVEGSPNRGTLRLAYDAKYLYALYDIQDASPWKNEGKDFTRLFKSGDAVDLQLSTSSNATADRDVAAGDVRIVFALYQGKPAAVLMQPVDPTAPESTHVTHASPVGSHKFDRVQLMENVKVDVKVDSARYVLLATIPLDSIGLKVNPGMSVRGDAGIISSDAAGLANVARTYWSNKETNLVNDLPNESWLDPTRWGALKFE